MARRDGVYMRNSAYWISWMDVRGIRCRRKTAAQNLAEARQMRAEELRRVEQSRVLGFTPPGKQSFETVVTEYLQRQKVNLTLRAYQREFDIFRLHLKPFFAGPLADVRRGKIEKYLVKRNGDNASPATICKELQILKHLFRFATLLEYVPNSPAVDVKGPKEPAGRVRYLQPQELRVLLERCPVWLKPIVGLAVSTGMRQGEILKLKWMDIDWSNRVAVLRQTKNGESRLVPLNEMALAVVNSLPEAGNSPSPSKLLFPVGEHNRVSVAFGRACRACGIHDFRFHDLRHTAASWLRMSGADLHTVATLLGHKSLRMTSRYSHLSPSFLAKEVSRLDSAFAGVLSGDAVVTKVSENEQASGNSSKHAEARQSA